MATIRNCFLIDSSLCNKFEVIYTDSLKNIQDQLSKYRWCYIQEAPDMTNKVVYTDSLKNIQDQLSKYRWCYIQEAPDMTNKVVYTDSLKNIQDQLSKYRWCYIPPNIPKLIVNS